MRTRNTIHRSKTLKQQGSVVLIVVVTSAILGMSLASVLRLAANQHRSVARSRAWNLAIPVAEAGIEEALAQIARNTNIAGMSVNGWYEEGGAFVKTRYLGENRFETRIIPSDPPVIESSGFAKIPYRDGPMLERRVRVTTTNTTIYSKAMAAEGRIDLNGNDISTDSFDSSDPNYSTDGMYDPAKKKDNGDVATNSGLANSLAAGNANILGDVATGYGGSVDIGSSGIVGDADWHSGGNTGIQPGMAADDMNIDFPHRDSPFTVGLPPVSGTVEGTNYTYLLPEGDFVLSTLRLSGTNAVRVAGNVRLYVAGDILIGGEASIQIEPGASLTLYAAGARTSIGGSGILNGTGYAQNFSYIGLDTNTRVDIGGNADFVGTLYAPNAALSLGGGGDTVYDFIGALVANTITMNGHYSFHYDEALAGFPTPGHYTVTSWNEF